MTKLAQSVKALKERCDAEQEKFLKRIDDEILKVAESIMADEASQYDADLGLAALRIRSLSVMPGHVRIGKQEISVKGRTLCMPYVIDLSQTAGYLFFMPGHSGSGLLQRIGFHLLLALKPGLCNLHLVDANFGNNFNQLGSLKHPQLETSIIYSQSDVDKMIKDLGKIVVEANRTYLSRYPDLSAYNSDETNTPKPYNVVLIDDYPSQFSREAMRGLAQLVNNHNARKSGIYIFVNHKGQLDPMIPKMELDQTNAPFSRVVSQNGEITVGGHRLSKDAGVTLDGPCPQIRDEVQTLLNSFKQAAVKTDILDDWIEEMKQSGRIWQSDTISGINVPVGFDQKGKPFHLYMGDDTNPACLDYFALVGGMSGTGKTAYLKTVITGMCMHYSPRELELYILDFSNGSGFDIYSDLPHVKALMTTNSIEFAHRVLVFLTKEAERRAKLYQSAQRATGKEVQTLAKYRTLTGEPLPRIVLLMDEFQWLFKRGNYDSDLVSKSRALLIEGVRQWRKFGIIVILSTQTMEGVNIGEADQQINYRFAFNMTESDSRLILGNEGAARLDMERGRCLMHNSTDRSESLNKEFRVVWSESHPSHVSYLAKRYLSEFQAPNLPLRFICDSNPADIAACNDICALKENQHECHTYLGKPNFMREAHTRVRYRRQSHSNTVIIGEDTTTAVNVIGLSLMQAKKQSAPQSRYYVIDCSAPGDRFAHAFDRLPALGAGFVTGTPDLLNDLKAELERRKAERDAGRYSEDRIFVTLFNAQSAHQLKPKPGGGFMGASRSPLSEALCDIIKDGPELGMHCIMHTLGGSAVFRREGLLGESLWHNFENKVLLSGADVSEMTQLDYSLKAFGSIGEGTLVVFNNRMDNEAYEVCKAYSKYNEEDITIDSIFNLQAN